MLSPYERNPLSPALQAVIGRTLDPTHGLLTELREDRPHRQAAHIRIVRAKLAPPAYFRDNAPSPVRTVSDGCGASFDRETAYWSAIGEAVERYAASIYWADELRHASASELGEQAINLPPLIRVARPEVCEFAPENQRVWGKGTDLSTGRPVFVPAMLCYLGYRSVYAGEILAQSDSTGLACAGSFEDGCLRALCEVIERDVFASNWLLSRRPQTIHFSEPDLTHFSKPVQAALKDGDKPIAVLHLALSFGVHVVMAFIAGERGLCSIGAAASPSIHHAVEKGVAEVLQGWSAINSFPVTPDPLDVNDLKTPFDHLRYYLHSDRMPLLANMCQGEGQVRFVDLCAMKTKATVSDIVSAIGREGYQAVGIDLTTDDVADLGFKVVRVVVPGLQPLVFGPACTEVRDARRLQVWAREWGLEANAFNPHPHPFP